jgi:hypothetical protein
MSSEVLYTPRTHTAERQFPEIRNRSNDSLIECQKRESNPRCTTRPHLFGHVDQQRRLGKSPRASVRQRRRALHIGAGRTEDARRLLRTVVIATELLNARSARKRFGTIVVAAKSFHSANRRHRFGAIVVAAAIANAVRDANAMQDFMTEVGPGQLRWHHENREQHCGELEVFDHTILLWVAQPRELQKTDSRDLSAPLSTDSIASLTGLFWHRWQFFDAGGRNIPGGCGKSWSSRQHVEPDLPTASQSSVNLNQR